jgi:hypothetical protein
MRDIAKLLFGDEAGSVLSGLFAPGRDGDGFEAAERVRRSGEWCGTTPGKHDPGGPLADVFRGTGRPGHKITIRF